MKRLLAVLALLPTPALATVTCTVVQQCGGGTCKPYEGEPFTIEEAGGVTRVSAAGQVWETQAATTADEAEMTILLPLQNGMSGLISIYPAGEFLFTAHTFDHDGATAVTGQGTCLAPG
jgi:hypothetical protein